MNAWLTDINIFANWFSENGTQVKPNNFVAFGIPISSRYGKVCEIIQMLAFTNLAAATGVAGYIDSIFFDSKSCCCTIELKKKASRQPDVQLIVNWCGDHTLSTFTSDETGTLRGYNYLESANCVESPA